MNQRARDPRILLAAVASAALLFQAVASAAPPSGKGPKSETTATPPAVTITMPTREPGISTTETSVYLEAQVKSSSQIAQVRWWSDRGPTGTAAAANGNRWVAGNVVLATGVNTLTMTATDSAGLSGFASVHVTLLAEAAPQPPPPEPGAPVIQSVTEYADRIELTWSQPGDIPDGGYSVTADSQAGTLLQTHSTYATLTQLDSSVSHCLTVTAHYQALGQSLGSAPACSDPVTPPNTAPVISGTPSTSVEAGQPYSFQPEAGDSDGDSLGFSIVNKPVWASFDTLTGRLQGTPAENQTGFYRSIEIAVSDGYATTALPAFDIEVTTPPGVIGTATLSWLPPTQREDGSALTDLAGYRIYYGRAGGSLEQSISIDNPGLTTWIVEGLAEGEWCFFVTAVDGAGRESGYSNEARKTVGL